MHTDQLAYFLHVAETGSINAAAQKFFITQQAISAQLKKLEDELEVPLLNRSTKGITLTPQGQLFIPYAQSILRQQDEAKYELQRFTNNEVKLTGTLSIFSSSVFSDSFLPGVISDFMQLHPDTTIKIIEVNCEELLSYLLHGYCDLVLFSAVEQYIKDALNNDLSENIKILPLLDDTQVLCARPDHPLMKHKAVDNNILEQYAGKEIFRFSLYQITPVTMPELTYARALSSSNNADLHKKLMWEGLTVTYMPKLAYLNKFQKDGFACATMLSAHPISHCLLYRNNPEKENAQLLNFFLEFIQKQFRRRFGAYIKNEF